MEQAEQGRRRADDRRFAVSVSMRDLAGNGTPEEVERMLEAIENVLVETRDPQAAEIYRRLARWIAANAYDTYGWIWPWAEEA